jgi:hypothetical protein
MRQLSTRQAVKYFQRRRRRVCRQTLWLWRKRGLPYCRKREGVFYFDSDLDIFYAAIKRGRPKGTE